MTIAQQLKITTFPFEIKDENGNVIYVEFINGGWWKREFDQNGNQIYSEGSDGSWWKREYDQNGNEIYFEDSDGWWVKREFDQDGNQVYFEDIDGWWVKREFDQDGNQVYYENSIGRIEDNRPKPEPEPVKKQTAVECLYERLERMIPQTALYNMDKKKYFEQAKAMEKEQIKEGYIMALLDGDAMIRRDAEDYYNETYGGDK